MQSEPSIHSGAQALRAATLALILLASASTAFAYSWDTCEGRRIRWEGSATSMYINTRSFPAGSVWDVRLQNAMWHWNNVKGAAFKFYVGRDTDGTYGANGKNEVVLAPMDGRGGTLAVTKVRYHCRRDFFGRLSAGLDETDVVFDSGEPWSTGTLPYGASSAVNFEGVALHELGHALGLSHENRTLASMNAYYPNGGPLGNQREWDPLPDDREGVRYLYGDTTQERDLAGSVFRRTSSGGSSLVSSPISANRGSTVTIEFTFANLSTTTRETFDIGFYLSTNDIISTSDRLLGTNRGAYASRGYVGTYSRTLTIPTSVAPGTYYIGFVLDPANATAEAHEANGAPALPRTIRIY
jgi:hypothetical protein